MRSSLSCIDVGEVMGGEGRTTRVLIRSHSRGGKNCDCIIGVDLMLKQHERELYFYLHRKKPFVLVMAPQCTGIAGWGHLNKILDDQFRGRDVSISRHFCRICARCAKIQLLVVHISLALTSFMFRAENSRTISNVIVRSLPCN